MLGDARLGSEGVVIFYLEFVDDVGADLVRVLCNATDRDDADRAFETVLFLVVRVRCSGRRKALRLVVQERLVTEAPEHER